MNSYKKISLVLLLSTTFVATAKIHPAHDLSATDNDGMPFPAGTESHLEELATKQGKSTPTDTAKRNPFSKAQRELAEKERQARAAETKMRNEATANLNNVSKILAHLEEHNSLISEVSGEVTSLETAFNNATAEIENERKWTKKEMAVAVIGTAVAIPGLIRENGAAALGGLAMMVGSYIYHKNRTSDCDERKDALATSPLESAKDRLTAHKTVKENLLTTVKAELSKVRAVYQNLPQDLQERLDSLERAAQRMN